MEYPTKLKIRPKDGATEILILVSHPMETGLRVDSKTKEKVPAHFIQSMTIQLNGKDVAVADLGVAISKDPLVGVSIANAKKGDKVNVSWSDNQGNKGGADATV
ncbi:MAG: thiosulfate oxidation carrier complex protein SoxZ [Candidatus Muproteobacteria bacterium RBG_19FT_COMBO_61_10]|jgi:sulfur-oxidizing protein SoxZ|uniref:Thiosulfate oxidation carrier complex protein SoxZ n=1 Tax=Candidatus Muproteobacteria bacterium RBG_19FT_COMBO_61_10 TaxID=1817761 RepID=A0A1F6UP02_9PROT|nr:MAG: thiosulfate oxidation carrier complex protein SoxZ [Candidatus Muproteobacteria bacterium RBG_19FT_COMBO_61_10]